MYEETASGYRGNILKVNVLLDKGARSKLDS